MAKKPGTKIVRRSAVTGKFVIKAVVDADPNETETENRPGRRKIPASVIGGGAAGLNLEAIVHKVNSRRVTFGARIERERLYGRK
jgi:hypothetical protein